MKKVKEPEEIIKGFKGYDKDLKCRDFQYEIGKEYKTDKKPVRCTENGFHFCENPLDLFNYYTPADSRFGEVEGSGEVSRDNSDSKIAVSNIKIGAEISLHSLIESGIKFIFERTTLTKERTNTEDKKQASNSGDSGAVSNSGYRGAASNSGRSGAASNSGYSGAASNSGDSGAASNSGYRGAASNSGDRGAASNSGDRGAASNSGRRGAASNSGYRGAASNSGRSGAASNSGYSGAVSNSGDSGAASNSGRSGAASNSGYSGAASNSGDSGAASNSGRSGAASNSGDSGAVSNSGDSGAAMTTGSYSTAETKVKNSIACGLGYESKASGVKGSWIVITEWEEDKEGNFLIKSVKTAKVDGKRIKENTFYKLENGKFTEVC
jgi:hypothetical protein